MDTALERKIQMVDVKSQYLKIQHEIDDAILEVVRSTQFINGPKVKEFQKNLEEYLGVNHVIPCANGTDALQVALMACDLKPGDEVIVPSFTYVATAEVIALLQLKPVMVEVDPETFNVTAEIIEKAITDKTKVIVPVHLYGQSSDLEPIMELAEKHKLFVIEDNAQAIGAEYKVSDGTKKKVGTIGHIGCTSFYPSKNLGCYGDGGAIFTNDAQLGNKIRMIANHGQAKKYYHSVIGCNSRLDSIQAAVLDVKLKYLDDYAAARNKVANAYDAAFRAVPQIETPKRFGKSTHVFHQYTLKILDGRRDELKEFLTTKGIPSMIYYPVPLYRQEAFKPYFQGEEMNIVENLCSSVISLPIHTEMKGETQDYICAMVKEFFN